jgi:hypothetical protein
MDLCGELNRLAGIPYDARIGIAGAATLWAGAPAGTELVGALNLKAGYAVNGTCLELNGILQRLGLTGVDQGGFTLTGASGLAEGGGAQLQNTLRLPGLTGNYMSTPDTPAASITGDIDIRVKVALDRWTVGSGEQTFLGKWDSGTNRSYLFSIGSSGELIFRTTPDGTFGASVSAQTSNTPGVGFAGGATKWVRVTRDVDNGSSQNVTKFYTSDDGATWSQEGTDRTNAGVTSIFDGPDAVAVGHAYTGTNMLMGNVYYAEVRSGIDGPVVAKFDSTTVAVRGDRLPTTHTQASRAEAIRLPGVAGNYISQPDSAANSVTGNIDIRCKVALDDWTPGATASLLSKQASTVLRSYRLDIESSSGKPFLGYSIDGSTNINTVCNVGTGFTDGATGWVRVTRVAATGVCNFYTSTDGAMWSQLGTANVAGTAGALFDSTSSVELGSVHLGTAQMLGGAVYQAEVRNGIDGPVVASFNAAAVQPTGAKTPSTVDLWTINGAAWSWDTPTDQPSSGALRLPGVAANYVGTPDAADISITGDVDLRCKVQLDDWTIGTNIYLISKLADTTGGYALRLEATTGLLKVLWADGTSIIEAPSTVATGLADGAVKWVRGTLDVDNGASGRDIKFYMSDDGVTWAQLGATVTQATATSIADNTLQLRIGEIGSGSGFPIAGYVYRAEVRSGIDGAIVASFDAESAPITTNRLPATVTQSGRVWTLNGSLWEWVNQPDPTEWTVAGSSWWWGTSKTPATQNVIELDPQYVEFPGTTGNYASTPDSAGLSITGDIDLRAKVALDDWTPAGETVLMMKWATGQQSWILSTDSTSNGKLRVYLSPDGTAQVTAISTVAVPFIDGQPGWVRATWVDSTNVLQFFTSNDGVTWTQLGANVTLSSAGIFDGTAAVTIGNTSGGNSLAGKVYYAEIRNGIGGTIVGAFSPSHSAVTAVRTPTTWGASPTLETWTMNGSAWSYGITVHPSITTPDSAALSITGDLDVRIKATLANTMIAGQGLINKFGSGPASGYLLRITASGTLNLVWGEGGGASFTRDSTVAIPFSPGQVGWYRAVLDVDNGAAGNDTKFYTSSDGVTWNQLGATVTVATATTIVDGTKALSIGSASSADSISRIFDGGTIHYAEVRSGIAGTVVGVFNPNVMRLTGLSADNTATTPTTMGSPTGETWTVTGSGWRWRAT